MDTEEMVEKVLNRKNAAVRNIMTYLENETDYSTMDYHVAKQLRNLVRWELHAVMKFALQSAGVECKAGSRRERNAEYGVRPLDAVVDGQANGDSADG